MELPEIYEAELHLQNGKVFTLLNPQINDNKGIYSVNGLLDFNQFKDLEHLKENFQLGKRNTSDNTSILLVGKNSYREMITVSELELNNFTIANLKIELVCYGCITSQLPSYENHRDELISISIEGLKLWFKESTRTNSERMILDKVKQVGMSSKRDYSQHTLCFNVENKKFDFNITFLQDKESENLIHLIIENKVKLDLEIYNRIKLQFRSFLSFPTGNTLFFRKETFSKDSLLYNTFYPSKKAKQRVYSDYILVSDPVHTDGDIFQDYLNCFDNFLIMDKYFDLTDIIFLLNQAKKTSLESGIFLMLIAMEKLGDRFIRSPFNTGQKNFIIDQQKFESLITNTINTFENDFKGINPKELGDLKSKLGSINKKGKTDKKIDDLLDFLEIKRTHEIDELFPMIRNLAIHEGRVDHITEGGYLHYKTLRKLLHDIIANLIQYKGLRYFGMEGERHKGQKIETFKTELENYR